MSEGFREFGKWAEARRQKLGLSMYAIGQRTGLHPTAIAKIERNALDVRLSSFVVICKALEADPSKVLKEILR